MKKILSVTLCSSFLFGALALAVAAKPAAPAYKESTADVMNEVAGMKKQAVRRVVGDSTTAVSKTYTQYGVYEGKYVIRFATAVKGDLESVSYFRSIAGGAEEEKAVSEVYKGIAAEDKVYYYDGSNLTEDASFAGQYYWACYTIAFSDESKWDTKVSAYLSVKAKDVEEPVVTDVRETTVNTEVELALPKFDEANVGKEYGGDQINLKITSKFDAVLEFDGVTINAKVASADETNKKFYLKNAETGEEYDLEFSNSLIFVSNLKYLKNGTLKEASMSSYDAALKIYMTSFALSIDTNKFPMNSEGKYEAYVSDTIYLTPKPDSDANVFDFSYSSNNKEMVNISTYTTQQGVTAGQIDLKQTGEVTIRVEDAHNPNLYKEVIFIAKERVYPTDDNWSIVIPSDAKVGDRDGVPTITIVEEGSVQLGADLKDITHNKEVTYTNSDTKREYVSVSKFGVVSGKKAGEATITLNLEKEDGTTSSKSVIIIVEQAAAGDVPASIVGTWSGSDTNGGDFTFVVNSNKNTPSIFSYDGGNVEFYYDCRDNNGDDVFKNEETGDTLIIYNNDSTLHLSGETELCYLFMDCWLYGVEISK